MTKFQKDAIKTALRSILVDRLRLLGFESNQIAEGLWILHKDGPWGAAGTDAVEVDLALGNFVEILERKVEEFNVRDGTRG